MSKKEGKRTSFAQKKLDNENITTRVVQFVDDPKNSDALAKIHEMSNKAKRAGNSPTHMRHIRIKDDEPADKNKDDNVFTRRKAHFATVKHQNLNILKDKKPKEPEVNNEAKNAFVRRHERNNSNSNIYNSGGDNVKYKTEYVWDKSINRLVEKKVPIGGEEQPKKDDKYKSKRDYQKPKNEIKEESQKEEKEEIIEKLKDFRKKNEGHKKKISYKIPKGGNNEKYSEVVYEKRIIGDDEDEDEFEKEISNSNSKNTKVFRKVIKNEPGSKVVITKKVIEESSEQTGWEKLQFDDDSDDDMDIEKEFKEFNLKPSEFSKQNVKVKVVTEEYDEKGNKIYSKEYTSNKLPKNFDKFD